MAIIWNCHLKQRTHVVIKMLLVVVYAWSHVILWEINNYYLKIIISIETNWNLIKILTVKWNISSCVTCKMETKNGSPMAINFLFGAGKRNLLSSEIYFTNKLSLILSIILLTNEKYLCLAITVAWTRSAFLPTAT